MELDKAYCPNLKKESRPTLVRETAFQLFQEEELSSQIMINITS